MSQVIVGNAGCDRISLCASHESGCYKFQCYVCCPVSLCVVRIFSGWRAYVCALLSLCTFSIISSDADLDFVEVRGHCVDTACVLIVKISLCTYIAKHVSLLWTLVVDWQANLVFGMWLCTMWIFDHYMTYLELPHYIYALQSISVHYVLCRMCFYDKSYSKKNVFYAANLCAIGRYYWLWGTYSIFLILLAAETQLLWYKECLGEVK